MSDPITIYHVYLTTNQAKALLPILSDLPGKLEHNQNCSNPAEHTDTKRCRHCKTKIALFGEAIDFRYSNGRAVLKRFKELSPEVEAKYLRVHKKLKAYENSIDTGWRILPSRHTVYMSPPSIKSVIAVLVLLISCNGKNANHTWLPATAWKWLDEFSNSFVVMSADLAARRCVPRTHRLRRGASRNKQRVPPRLLANGTD